LSHKIVQQLRRERRLLELSQDVIAAKTGYDRAQVSQYERGIHSPKIEMISDWANALGFELALVKKQ
jgi:transcriptional regulator with XRE-family HTH domain